MLIGDLNIPEALLETLRNDELVIFAGAGVSIPPPSSLPSFRRLTEQIIGRPLDCEKGEHQQLDRVLGRAQDGGIRVHQRARDLLIQDEPRFNSLHTALIELFSPKQTLRIVTTNFDLHFEEALGERAVKRYSAPALPTGSHFSGIVHLHGSLDEDPEGLVLTDADFGRAYLTEGWAGRFLVELFKSYTVLFAGYSWRFITLCGAESA